MVTMVIVDDEPLIRKGLESLDWESIGVHVVGVVSNGLDALAIIKRYRPNILFTDIKMPGIDGLQLIRMAQQLCPNIRSIILTGYTDFEYARKAITLRVDDYILKPCEPQEVLDTIGRIVRPMVAGKGMDGSENLRMRIEDLLHNAMKGIARQNTDQFNELNQTSMVVALLQNDEEAAHGSIINIIGDECKKSELLGFWTVPMESNMTALVFRYGFGEEFDLEEMVASACCRAFERAGAAAKGCRLGISAQLDGKKQLREGYLQAQKCLSLLFSRQDENCCRYTDSAKHIDRPETPVKQMQQVLSCFETRNYAGVEKAVEELCDFYRSHPVEECFIKYVIIDICRSSQYIMAQRTADAMAILAMDEYLAISDAPSLKALESYTKQFLRDNINRMQSQSDIPANQLFYNIEAYIDAHYAEDIGLNDLAAHVHMNRDYLGRLIKKQYQTTFNQLLLTIRLEKSCVLLADSDMPISNIAGAVGINDPRYFGQVFKNRYHMPPSEYRKKTLAEAGKKEKAGFFKWLTKVKDGE